MKSLVLEELDILGNIHDRALDEHLVISLIQDISEWKQ